MNGNGGDNTKWTISEGKRQISYGFIDVWNIKKNNKM